VKELLGGLDRKTIEFIKVSTIRCMRIYERHICMDEEAHHYDTRCYENTSY
jgi:hypothetical protein